MICSAPKRVASRVIWAVSLTIQESPAIRPATFGPYSSMPKMLITKDSCLSETLTKQPRQLPALPNKPRLSCCLALGMVAWLAGPRQGVCQVGQSAATQLRDSMALRPAYPALRPLLVQTGLLPARRITTKYEGVDLKDTNAQPGYQIRVTAAAPVLITKPVILLVGVNYLREHGSYDTNIAPIGTKDSTVSYTREDMSVSLTAMRQDSLFHRPITYLLSVTGTSRGVNWPEKFTGGLTALLTLRSTPVTKLSVGLTLQANRSVKIPATPVITYWHRFGRSPWEFDAVLPQRLHLRRPLLANKFWFSVGTDIMSTHSFGSGTVPGFSSTFEANTVSLQNGALIEYVVNPYFMVGIRGGMDTPVSMWVGEKDSSHMAVEGKAKTAAYVGLNLTVTFPSRQR